MEKKIEFYQLCVTVGNNPKHARVLEGNIDRRTSHNLFFENGNESISFHAIDIPLPIPSSRRIVHVVLA